MGRHGERATRAARRERGDGDGTAKGVALPLIAAALVCLLATSGVWLFSGKGDEPKKNTEAIGLNVPSQLPEPPRGNDSTQSPSGSAPASPRSPSAASASASKSPSKSPTTSKPPASPTAARTTTQPPPSPPAPVPTSAAPPSPPPPPQADPADVNVTFNDRWWPDQIRITNTSALPLNGWRLEVTLDGGREFTDFDVRGSEAQESHQGRSGTAFCTCTLAPGATIIIDFDADWRVRSASYTLNGHPGELD